MTDERLTADGRRITMYYAGQDAAGRRSAASPLVRPAARPVSRTAAPARTPAPEPAGRPAARPGKKPRGVTAGRVVAAGVGVAAMVGLAAQMQVAGNAAAAAAPVAPQPASPSSTAALLRWEQGVRQTYTAALQRYAAADARKPIVLTPHTIVNTVGGGSSGGYSGSSGYSAAPSYSAPAAAPVASSGGSAPH